MKPPLTVGLVWPSYVREDHRAEILRFLPEDIGLEMRGTFLQPSTEPEDITLERAMEEAARSDIEDTAAKLVSPGVASIGYGCTSISYIRGVKGEADISRRMAEATGLPVTTTSGAVVAALRQLSVARVAVLSPHIDAMNERLRSFLDESEIDVVKLKGLNMRADIEELPPREILKLILEVDDPEAEGIFVSCTGMMTSTIIEEAERETGKPVVTANQATMWRLLRLAEAQPAEAGPGRLFGGWLGTRSQGRGAVPTPSG